MRRKKDKSNGITALYERLSRDDDNAGESNSIVHQKQMLEDYAMLEDSGASRHCAYLVVDQVNPGLTDLFTRQFRKVAQEQQKSSVLQKLKQEPPAHKPAAPKKQEPER